jgi:hypothetical protein
MEVKKAKRERMQRDAGSWPSILYGGIASLDGRPERRCGMFRQTRRRMTLAVCVALGVSCARSLVELGFSVVG